jgi:hypothetical protein
VNVVIIPCFHIMFRPYFLLPFLKVLKPRGPLNQITHINETG